MWVHLSVCRVAHDLGINLILGFNLNWSFLFHSDAFYSDLGSNYVLGNHHKTRFGKGKDTKFGWSSFLLKAKERS